jgi:streptogramin lyase
MLTGSFSAADAQEGGKMQLRNNALATSLRQRIFLLAGFMACLFSMSETAAAQQKYGIIEYVNVFPSSLATGPDGGLWFAEVSSLAHISPSGAITQYPLPVAFPTSLVAGPDGALWFPIWTQNYPQTIGRMTTSGVFTQYSVLSDATGASAIGGITSGPGGVL